MKSKTRWRVMVAGGLLLVVFGTLIGLWVMAGSVASPDRRELQDYHRDYLAEPAAHGMVVHRRAYVRERVPCLVVRPDEKAGPGKRGKILRRQLQEAGVALFPFGGERGLVVLLHGRNGRKEDLLPVAERFGAVGFVCLLPDLPSHGESPVQTVGFGKREMERALAGAVADEAAGEFGWEKMDQFLWGISMGGSFAVHAASLEPDRWTRMVIVSSFDRLEGVVGDSLGWFSGMLGGLAGAMIQWRGGPDVSEVNPVIEASKIKMPVLVVHGDQDELISMARGKDLCSGFSGRRKFVPVPGGNHDNVLVTEAPVFAEMARWLLKSDDR